MSTPSEEKIEVICDALPGEKKRNKKRRGKREREQKRKGGGRKGHRLPKRRRLHSSYIGDERIVENLFSGAPLCRDLPARLETSIPLSSGFVFLSSSFFFSLREGFVSIDSSIVSIIVRSCGDATAYTIVEVARGHEMCAILNVPRSNRPKEKHV